MLKMHYLSFMSFLDLEFENIDNWIWVWRMPTKIYIVHTELSEEKG